jgi:hypothetical protein
MFSAIFVFQKSYTGNILGIGRNKFLKSYFAWKLLIRLQRIYNFSCSMLVYTLFAYCFVTLRGTFMHFLELTY